MENDNLWLDPLYLDDLLNEEEKSIRKSLNDKEAVLLFNSLKYEYCILK